MWSLLFLLMGGEFAPQQDPLPVPAPPGAVVLFDGEGTNLMLSKVRFRNVWVRPLDDDAILYEPDMDTASD